MGKKIEVGKVRVGDLKHEFGNPRKISRKKIEELEHSLDTFGDFGIILIDEKNNVIAGNQRSQVLAKKDPDIMVDVKRLVGFSEAELRSINIQDNTHAGEWDLELLAEWTSDLNLDLGLDLDNKNPEERKIDGMELIYYEKYDYVLIACRSELDYNDMIRKLGIEGKKVSISKRKINARAIWYDQMKATLVPNDELEKYKNAYYRLAEIEHMEVEEVQDGENTDGSEQDM